MPQDKKVKPARPAFAPARPVKKPAYQAPKNNFSLGGRRFNGQAMRRGSRH
ncbi:MAG: hypothetical protein JNK82_23335 [Myxococcaceae bacterium]|nr:hypothetical protein [Myxococcaceae bacterium]